MEETTMIKFKVLRRHLGDKAYEEGDEREANAGDVAHLVAAGVLEAPENKAAAPVENKGRARK
jgi:hypothetical protein